MKHKGRTWRKRQKKCSDKKPTSLAGRPEYIVLFKWAKKNGVKFHNMRPCLFPCIGRGLMATGLINSGDALISVPKRLLITGLMIKHNYLPMLKAELNINTIDLLCMFLLIEHSLGTTSFWHPYINMLPKQFNTPSYFSEEVADVLPAFLYEQWQIQVKKIKKCQKHLEQLLGYISVKRRKGILLTFEYVRWAWNVVNTRCVYMDYKDHLDQKELGMNCALVPLLDLLNHSSEAEVQAGFSQETHHYNIHTNTRFTKGNQIFINYGPHGNRNLLIEYGFILPNNFQNSIKIDKSDIYNSISKTEYFLEKKYSIIQKYNLEDSYSCTLTGLSWSLKTAFKILSLDKSRLCCNKSLNIENLVLTSEEKTRFLIFSKIILNILLEKYNSYFTKMESALGDLNSSQDRLDLVHQLLKQENEMLANALTMLK